MAVSLQDLAERFQLSDKLLDASPSEDSLIWLSRIIDDHDETLAPELGLTPDEVTTESGSEQLQNFAMLKKWKQVSAWKATYRELIEALLKHSRADLAQQVCDKLAQSDQYVKEGPSHTTPAHSVTRGEQPTIDVSPDLDRDTSELRQTIKHMEEMFVTLVNATSEELKKLKVRLLKIQISLCVRRASDIQADVDRVVGVHHLIREANTVDDLFDILSAEKCWDFLNPGLLNRIIDDHCSESQGLQHQKKEYMKKLRRFRRTTTAQQYAKVRNMSISSDKISELVSEMGKDWDHATLEDVENLKQRIRAESFLIHSVFNYK